MRVLLVEDEPNAAHVLAKGLREQTYAVDIAADGDTAIFQVGTTDYDAVILDVMLPVRDGFAVCRAIRGSGCAVPMLMVTARDAVGRGDIAEHVWDEHYDPVSNVVDVYVQRLRRKLDRSGCESLIRTRRGEGYQLVTGADAS